MRVLDFTAVGHNPQILGNAVLGNKENNQCPFYATLFTYGRVALFPFSLFFSTKQMQFFQLFLMFSKPLLEQGTPHHQVEWNDYYLLYHINTSSHCWLIFSLWPSGTPGYFLQYQLVIFHLLPIVNIIGHIFLTKQAKSQCCHSKCLEDFVDM